MVWRHLLYVISGSLNVFLLKWSDNLEGQCYDGIWRRFQHPIFQTALMFLAQFICFIVYKSVFKFLKRREDGSEDMHVLTRGAREFSLTLLILPSVMEMIATFLLYSGLYLTYAVSFQELRVSCVIFVGIFSAIYLNQSLNYRHWLAMLTIIFGISMVFGVDLYRLNYDTVSLPHADYNSVLTGNLMIICGSILHASKYVYEEKLLKGVDIPVLQAVGWQGIFGLIMTTSLIIGMNFLPTISPFDGNSRGVYDDFGDIFSQLSTSPWILVALILFVISCACYNSVALYYLKIGTCAERILADCLCIFYIYIAVMICDWEGLNIAGLLAGLILLMGAIAYRNAIFIEWYRAILSRLNRNRYVDMTADDAVGSETTSRPADLI